MTRVPACRPRGAPPAHTRGVRASTAVDGPQTSSDLLRKKHTGEPGNKGEFGHAAKAGSGLTLDAPPGHDTTEDDTPTVPRLVVPEWAVPLAQKRVDAANRRLERAGIPDRFSLDVGDPYLRDRPSDGRKEMVCDIRLSHPTISYDGWSFVAALDTTPDGSFITRNAPGEELHGWRPQEALCEHCGTRRHRTTTYVLRHTDGTITQVGSTCIQDFLGVKPAGLWTLDADLADQIESDVAEHAPNHAGQVYTPVDDVVALALAASDGGRGYRSASQWSPGSSTVQVVRDVLFTVPRTRDEEEERTELEQQAARYRADGTVDEVLRFAADLAGDSDYATNLRTLATQDHVGPKHLGILASAVAVWARDRAEQTQRQAQVPPAAGWLGPVGTKLTGRSATVEKVVYVDNPYDPYGGVNTLVIMRADTGHTLKWFATGRKDLDTGQRLSLTGGTVKDNDTYQGTDQTVVTRVRYEVLPDDDGRDEEGAAGAAG